MSAAFTVARTLQVAEATAAPRVSEAEVLELDIAFFQRRIARDTLSARDFAELARLFLQRSRAGGGDGDLRRAEASARHSLGLRASRNAEAFQVLAASLMGQHRFGEALEAADGLLALDSTSRGAQALLGEIQVELGDYAAAGRTFGMLLTVRGDLSVAPRYARWEELRGRPAEARRLLRAARDQIAGRHGMPVRQLAWYQWRLGDLALRNGRLDEAERELASGLSLAPDDHLLLHALARTAMARRRWPEAIAYAERSILQSMDPATLGLLYQAYAASGDSARAEEYSRAMSVAVRGQTNGFHRAWGLLLLDRGRDVPTVLARAERDITVRHDVYGWDLLAWARYRSGRLEEARDAMRHALALGTRDASFHFHAGMIDAALGLRVPARRQLEAAFAINPRWHPTQPAEARAVLERLGARRD
ncbi:MAG TPA: tetratricopeptide repeat protein [Gemmatimonadales bacterium]